MPQTLEEIRLNIYDERVALLLVHPIKFEVSGKAGWYSNHNNNVTYRHLTKQRPHIEMIEAKAFRTFIRISSLFRNKRLSANIKLTLQKALSRSAMTYACLA
jgi:hypothetical protein